MLRRFIFSSDIHPAFCGNITGAGGVIYQSGNHCASYNLQWLLGEGCLPVLLGTFKAVGVVVFGNLPLLFAMAVALGLARQEKAVAVFSAAISFIAMHSTINVLLAAKGIILSDGKIPETAAPGTLTSVLGITSLELGVFGGIILGMTVSFLHNRFYKIQLPSAISFFAGTRFVPIISVLAAVLLGYGFELCWPFVQAGISSLGKIVVDSGVTGTFLFGAIERGLIPFGLHHAFIFLSGKQNWAAAWKLPVNSISVHKTFISLSLPIRTLHNLIWMR